MKLDKIFMNIICTNCSNQLPKNAKFCNKCGTAISVGTFKCDCGKNLPQGAKFCSGCGKSTTQSLDSLQKDNSTTCECGHITKTKVKFCPICGKNHTEVAILKDAKENENKNLCKCGAELSENMKFCASCGIAATNLPDNLPPDMDSQTPEPGNPTPPPPQTQDQQNKIQDSSAQLVRPLAEREQQNQNTENTKPTNNLGKRPGLKQKKSATKKVLTAFGILALLIISTSLAWFFIGKTGDRIETITVNRYYPESGPQGSFVLFGFEENPAEIQGDLEIYYNNKQLNIHSVTGQGVVVQLPQDAIDGEFEIRKKGKIHSKHPFKIEKTEFIPLASSVIKPSGQVQTIELGDEVSVRIPPGFVNRETNISVSRLKNTPALPVSPFYKPSGYEIVIDGMQQLPDFIEIRLPFNPELLNENYSTDDQVFAFRRDAGFMRYTGLPYRIDESNSSIYIYTDHLTLIEWVILGVGSVVLYQASYMTEPLMYNIYTTPQKNFRILYNKDEMSESNHFNNSSWERLFQPSKTFSGSYDSKHLIFVQDIGEYFESALSNYRKAGFKEPVVKPGWIRNETINPINIKLDSYLAQKYSDPAYFAGTGYIHIPSVNSLISFRNDANSFSLVGHELFHRMQAEYYYFTQYVQKISPHYWWIEASAEYAGCRIAWGDVKYENMFAQIPHNFLSYPINTVGLPDAGFRNDYEYHAAVFIYYLVEVRGLNFARLFENVAKGNPLISLDNYLKTQSGNRQNLADFYRDFARWAFFAEGTYNKGFFRKYPIANFEDDSQKDLAEQKDILSLPAKNEFIISVDGAQGVTVEIIKMKGNQKLSQNNVPSPIAVLKAGEEKALSAINNDEMLCIMAVNTEGKRTNVAVTISEPIEGNQKRTLHIHRFYFSDNYSAKLWVLKPETVKMKITPDSISDGITGEKYRFKINAENIPTDISRVYLEYDFDDLQNHSKGKTNTFEVKPDGTIEKELEYTFVKDTRKSKVRVKLFDAIFGTELAEAFADIEFYNVRIKGDRNIAYIIADNSSRDYKQKFIAEASPRDNYYFEWDFGDGNKSKQVYSTNQKSEIEHEYKNLSPGQKFEPTVRLFDKDKKLVAEDRIVIRVEEQQKETRPPTQTTPPAASTKQLTFSVCVYVSYTEGFKDDRQTFIQSEYKTYDFGPWKVPVGTGGSFSGQVNHERFTAKVNGSRTDNNVSSISLSFHRKWTTGTDLLKEEWFELEARNIPFSREQGTYFRWGWQCDPAQPDPAFRNNIIKLEHRVKFYPSGKEIRINNIDYNRSEAQACRSLNVFTPKSYIQINFSDF